MAQVYKNESFFQTRLTVRRFWVSEPRHSDNILTGICSVPLSQNASETRFEISLHCSFRQVHSAILAVRTAVAGCIVYVP